MPGQAPLHVPPQRFALLARETVCSWDISAIFCPRIQLGDKHFGSSENGQTKERRHAWKPLLGK